MIDLLHSLSDWIINFTTSDWAVLILAITSFSESIFFPIPPDPLMLGIGLLQPKLAIWLGILVTITSVLGALVGYWIGNTLGQSLLCRIFPRNKIRKVEDMFHKYGGLAIFISAFTPLPYKLFAISAGALKFNRRKFVMASLIGRGTRFITLGILIYLFGEPIQKFITGNFEVITAIFSFTLITLVIAYAFIKKRYYKSPEN